MPQFLERYESEVKYCAALEVARQPHGFVSPLAVARLVTEVRIVGEAGNGRDALTLIHSE
jgi:hypothetical protein